MTFAGLFPVVQGRERAEAGERRCQFVADGNTHARGGSGGVTDHIAQSAHSLADGTEAGTVRIRSRLAVAGDANHDEARIDLAQLLPAAMPLFHGARAEVLQNKIRVDDHFLEQSLTFRLPHVQGDGLLVPADDRPPQGGFACSLTAPGAHRVTLARGFNFDHFGTHIPQQLAAERSCQQGAQLQHAQVGQGTILEGIDGHRESPEIRGW